MGKRMMVVKQERREGGPDVMQRAVFQRETLDVESRSVTAVVVHGTPARMTVWDWARGAAIENVFVLGGGTFPERVPMLESHSSYTTDAIRGSAMETRVAGNRVMTRLEFAADAASEASWLKIRDGHLNAVSIGASIQKAEYVEPGESREIGGVVYKAGRLPLRVNLEWTLQEVSLVVFGADPKAKVMPGGGKGAPGGAKRSEQAMKYLKAVLVQMGLVSADADDAAVEAARAGLSVEQLAVVQAAVTVAEQGAGAEPVQPAAGAEPVQPAAGAPAAPAPVQQTAGAPAGQPVDVQAVAQAAIAAERQRQVGIRTESAGLDIPESVVQAAIDGGMTVEQARQSFLQLVRQARANAGAGNPPVGGAPFINVGAGRAELANDALQAAVCQSMGMSFAEPGATGEALARQNRVLEEAGRFRGVGLLEMARQSLILRGQYPGVDRSEMVRQALSNTDFSNAFANTIGRALMNEFDQQVDTTAGLFEEEELQDYRAVERILTDPMEQLSPLPEGGEAAHASASDAKETYQLARYAKQFVLDEIQFINDDLGVLQRAIRQMGLAASRLRPELVYAIINSNPAMRDSVALFDAAHNNTTTGALAASTLQTAITKMAKQYRLAGKQKIPLNLRAAHLLVPADLEFTALQLVNSVERGDGSGNGTANVLRGRLNVVVDDRLGVNGSRHPYTGTVHVGTATNYYLLADRMANTMMIGYLAGSGRRPVVRRFELSQGRYGVGVDVKHVIGAKPMSWEGWVKSTGA